MRIMKRHQPACALVVPVGWTAVDGRQDALAGLEAYVSKGVEQSGDVMIIDFAERRTMRKAATSYSTMVAGIYSTKPGVLANPYGLDDPKLAAEIPLAVIGIVPCKVTTENGAIQAGDLLVTSSLAGHAMKGTDRSKMLGAIVGKH